MNGSLWGDILEMGMKAVQRISALIALSSNFADEKPLSPLGKRWILGLEHRDNEKPESTRWNGVDTTKLARHQKIWDAAADGDILLISA
jgi:ribulose bisphosphate carboxylase small subunit